MNEENNDVSSETQTQSTEGEVTQTLDDLVPEFNITPQAQPVQNKQTTTREEISPAVYDAPDPVIDPDGFKKWSTGTSTEINTLRSELRDTVETLTQHAQKVREKNEEKEISTISQELATKIGEGTNPEMVEVALGLRYRKDATFKKIWDNRNNSPTAFKKAMGIVGNDMKGMFSRTIDPQTAENVRAMNKSTNQASNRSKESASVEEKFKGDSFASEWAKLLNG